MHKDLRMEYFMEKPSRSMSIDVGFRNLVEKIFGSKPLIRKINGLQADYAIAMDQCQLMKQHILELENKISSMNAKVELQPDVKDVETPYSVAILLAKRGCDREEIITECGLTESEADLILALHNRAPETSQNSIAIN